MTQLGQHPAPLHAIAHISDTHFLAGGKELYGSVRTERHLEQALKQLERSDVRPEAIVFTGDLADLGEPDAYQRLRAIVEPAAERLGAQVIWVMGNHDERLQYSQELFDEAGSEAPQDRVYDVGGLLSARRKNEQSAPHCGEGQKCQTGNDPKQDARFAASDVILNEK